MVWVRLGFKLPLDLHFLVDIAQLSYIVPTMKSKQQKQTEADSRQEARDTRSDKEQLQRLDQMLGKGKGAKRERERLS